MPVLLGLLLPQSGKLKDAFLTPRAAKRFAFLQYFDEITRLYFSRILNREERKVSTLFLAEDAERRRRALDRLFEEHNLEIACEEARRLYAPETALGIFRVRHPAVKFKYLIRHLGYADCLRALRATAQRPEILFPSWPADQSDRRKGDGTLAGVSVPRR